MLTPFAKRHHTVIGLVWWPSYYF